MAYSKTLSALVAAALVVAPINSALADAGDVFGGIVGGIIGGAIVNEGNKQRAQKRTVVVKRSGISNAQRAENREVQTALNYFTFPAGAPDGALGRRSRAAIGQYQSFMGYPATGYLNQFEKDFLLNSYYRSINGGQVTSQLVSQNPYGVRGLLHAYRDGTQPTLAAPAPATTTAAAPAVEPAQPETTTVLASTPTEDTSTGGLPNFMGGGEQLSLASHCNNVSLVTNTNGGFTTVEFVQDATHALNEQFCLARTYAIAEGEQLMSSITGFSKAQIEGQCGQLGSAMGNEIASLSSKPNTDVMTDVSNFVRQNNISPAQMSGTAKVCLSVGYRTDNMDIAVSSTLLLVALGSAPHAELLGHHLNNGFGTTQRPDLAVAWYGQAIEALEGGVPAAFAPGQPERVALLRKAAMVTNQNTGGAASALPAFTVKQ